jgi:hypothetical protein
MNLSRFDRGRPCANDFLKKKFDNNAMRRQEMDAVGDDILTKVTGSQTGGFRKTTHRLRMEALWREKSWWTGFKVPRIRSRSVRRSTCGIHEAETPSKVRRLRAACGAGGGEFPTRNNYPGELWKALPVDWDAECQHA